MHSRVQLEGPEAPAAAHSAESQVTGPHHFMLETDNWSTFTSHQPAVASTTLHQLGPCQAALQIVEWITMTKSNLNNEIDSDFNSSV